MDVRFSDYFDPFVLSRDLTADHLRQAARRRSEKYNSKFPGTRQVTEAMQIGALHGAALARKALGVATLPIEALLEARIDGHPKLYRGMIPYVAESVASLYACAVAPRVVPLVQGVSGFALTPVLRYFERPEGRMEADKQTAAGCLAMLVVPLPLTLSLPVQLGINLGGSYVCAGAKIVTIAPAAMVGAAVGAVFHGAVGRKESVGVATFERGARNEETFALYEPVENIPTHFFFLSEDRFGIDLRELRLFLEASRNFINPHTNTGFSLGDQQRLIEHPHLPMGDWTTADVRIAGQTLLNSALWHTYFLFFLEVSRALTVNEGRDERWRNQAIDALDAALADAGPINAVMLRLFFETCANENYARFSKSVRENSSASYSFGLQIFRISNSVAPIFMGMDESKIREVLESETNRGNRIFDELNQMLKFNDTTIQYQQEQMIQRLPWLSYVAVGPSKCTSAANLGPINLSPPERPWDPARFGFAE